VALHQRQHQARTADSCSRALSRSSSPSTRTWNRESSCQVPAPALHRELPPGQGEGNLEPDRASETISLMKHAAPTFDPSSPGQPSLSSTNSTPGRTGSLMTRWSTKTDRGSPGATNCPATSSSARASTRPGPRELLCVEARRAQWNAGWVSPLPGQGQVRRVPVAQPRDAGQSTIEPAHSLQRSFTSPLPKFGPLKLFVPRARSVA